MPNKCGRNILEKKIQMKKRIVQQAGFVPLPYLDKILVLFIYIFKPLMI
jgi:hypothetical protein